MNVLVDTSVWSQALRRRNVDEESPEVRELRELVGEGAAMLIGPVRQELLSGIKHAHQFEGLRDLLRAFPDVDLATGDFERAAEFFTACRKRGVQGSNTDFLICAVSERLRAPIFTLDEDFQHFATVIPIALHRCRFEE
jgi:predicted nucleic acid-binding protein